LAQNDWIEVLSIFKSINKNYLETFLESKNKFCPSIEHVNIFNINENVYLNKTFSIGILNDFINDNSNFYLS